MRETSKAKSALADYLAMGRGRSLPKLAARYATERRNSGETAEASSIQRRLEEWSTAHGWVAQAEAQDRAEDAEMAERKAAERLKARERSLLIVQGAKARYSQQVAVGEIDYRTAHDLEIIVKLEMALLGEPLAERHEFTGENGAPLAITLRIVDDAALLTPDGNGNGNGGEH